jgi:hypothetical protein
MLTYADACWRMLTYADVCWRMLTYADVGAFARNKRHPQSIYILSKVHIATICVFSYYICVLIRHPRSIYILSKVYISTIYVSSYYYFFVHILQVSWQHLRNKPLPLTHADVCWRMLTYADVCWRMQVSWQRLRNKPPPLQISTKWVEPVFCFSPWLPAHTHTSTLMYKTKPRICQKRPRIWKRRLVKKRQATIFIY